MSVVLPLLYDPDESAFISNGLGALYDCQTCNVKEKRNGMYELELTYPITGQHYSDIQLRSIIVAKPSPSGKPQPFQVYRITRPMKGRVKVYAKHLSYNVSGIPVSPFTAVNVTEAVLKMNQNGMVANPFTMYTDKETIAYMENTIPTSYRSLMGGHDGSILDVYGGEWYYDWFDIHLKNHRGKDSGVSIRFGKNLTDLEQEEICEDVYTGILGYWSRTEQAGESGEETEIVVQGDIQYFHENPSYIRIYLYDLTNEFENQPTVEQINETALAYGLKVGLDVPQFTTDLSYEHEPDVLDSVELCDTIHVYFDKLGVDATAKVIETNFDVLKDRFTKITVGSARSTFAQTLNKTVSSDINESRKELILQSRQIVKLFTESIDGLRSSISDNIGNITAAEQTINDIKLQVSQLGESLNAIFTSNEAFIEFKQGIYDAIQAEHVYTTEQINGITSYIRVTNEPALILGRSDSNYKLKIMNNQMFYFSGSDTVAATDGTDINGYKVADVFAFFTDKELTVTLIKASDGIRIGLSNNGTDYLLSRRSNSHLTLKVV